MRITIDKKRALTTLCVARQAERSVDFALGSQSQWALLREYYDDERLQPVLDTLAHLEAATELSSRVISRDTVFPITVWGVLTYPLRWLVNHFRNRWRFRADEVQFMLLTLRTFLAALRSVAMPEAPTLVGMRMDLSCCEWIIGQRLAGVAEIDKAMRVEHFCQSDYLTFVTIQDVCGTSPMVAA